MLVDTGRQQILFVIPHILTVQTKEPKEIIKYLANKSGYETVRSVLSRLRAGLYGVQIPGRGTDGLWGPPSLLFSKYRGYFPGGKAAGAS